MRLASASIRARFGALLLCASALLAGCSTVGMPLWPWGNHHRVKKPGCSEKPFAGSDTEEPPLKVPEGLNAPDTRNAIKVPAPLSEPDVPRPKNVQCLDEPPDYATGPRAPSVPAATPAAAPSAAPAVAPNTAPPHP